MSYRRTRFREKMDKSSSVVGKCRNHLWWCIISSISLWLLLFYFHSSSLVSSKDVVRSLQKEYSIAVPNQSSKNGEETFTGNEYYIAVPSYSTQNRDESVLRDGMKVPEDQRKNPVPGDDENKPSKNEIITSEEQEPSEEARSKPSSGDEEKGISDQVELGTEEAEMVEPVKRARSKPRSVNRKPDAEKRRSKPKSDECSGKYIYIHPLPPRFNEDLLKDCRRINMWMDMCRYVTTMGLGPPIGSSRGVFSKTGWYATNQFVLDILIHNRMKEYKCLTSNSSMASAIFVPFYAGFDVSRHLWGYNTSVRDANSLALIKWLTATPEWKVLGGRDHFLVAGRITWDFRRLTDDDSDWGNNLMLLNESRNMTMLTIESSPWNKNDFAIPYPTYFHPSRDDEVFRWQNRMRRTRKRYLFSFAGGSRPNLTTSIRGQIMDQCQASGKNCKMLECTPKSNNKCENPSTVMKLFQSSNFCLQPPGDSYTRRSAFDSILAGCIPVFFHPGSAYVQYLWHLPKNFTSYSVLISEDEIRKGKVNIERKLTRIPREKVRAMREQVIRLIPRVIYADPRSRLKTIEDAFDLTIQGVFKRVDRARKAIRDGVDPDAGYRETNSWKYNFFGTEAETEWDPLFYRPKRSIS